LDCIALAFESLTALAAGVIGVGNVSNSASPAPFATKPETISVPATVAIPSRIPQMMTIPTTRDLPAWAKAFLREIREQETQANGVYDELMAAFRRATQTKRQAVSQFVATSHAIAAAVLSLPLDYSAPVVNFATGLLSEALAYVQADRDARWPGTADGTT
jgi:hypothetical protein